MRRPGPRALGIVCACLILLAAGVIAGVRWAQDRGSVTLLANWNTTDPEFKEFDDNVIKPFEKKYRIEVIYQGSSALSQVLAADIAAGTPPDVAVVPGPGELMGYARDGGLRPLDGLLDATDYDRIWVPPVNGHRYWLPVKAGLKSMVWYSEMKEEQVTEFAHAPRHWCLAMESGATSGWPGTDWVEDILLQQAGTKKYGDWANGRLAWTDDVVRTAWNTWGELVGAGELEHVKPALKDHFEKCSQRLEHQGSFRAGYWEKKPGGTFVHSAAVIPGTVPGTRWEVSGDLAVMLNKTEEARQLIRYLAAPETELPDYTVSKAASRDYDKNSPEGKAGLTLRDPDQTLCWDASDVMPRTMRDAFHQAVLRYLISPKTLDAELAALERLRVDQGTTQLPVCS